MPFTLSHAAAVLPFRRLNLVWSAFVIGTLAPDFPYAVGSIKYRALGHNFPGVVLFTLPASLAVLWLFHNVVRAPAVALCPTGLQQRLTNYMGEFGFGGVARFTLIMVSLVLGIATHLLWDALTHPHSWFWWRLRWLRSWIHVPSVGAIPMYAFLQYCSTVVGLIALAVWFAVWYRDTSPKTELKPPPVRKSQSQIAFAMFVIAGGAALVRALLMIGIPETRIGLDRFFMIFGVTSLALAFWQIFFYCLLSSAPKLWKSTG